MKVRLQKTRSRQGIVAALVALLLPVILGLLALSVDTGVAEVGMAQLQTAADAAALEGGRQLISDARISSTYDITPLIHSANTQAAVFAQANKVLNEAPVISQNPSNSVGGGDILVGYLPASTPSATLDSSA